MCQPKSKGGKRCQAHLHGSNATINSVTIATGESREDVTEVFRELRKEGKQLSAPTPEMVKQFAESQKFLTQFNPDLTDAQRARLSNHWDEAAQEEPTGATFHAWKHTLSEVLRRARTKVAAVFAAGTLSMALASCTSGGTLEEQTTPAPTPSETTVTSPTPSASPSLNESLNQYGIEIQGNEEIGLSASGPEFTDSYGTYNRAELDEDSPLLQGRTTEAYTEAVESAWDEETLEQGEYFTKQFVVSYILDGQSTYEPSRENATEYLEESSQYIADEWKSTWKETASKDSAALAKEGLGSGQADASVPLYVHYKDASFPEYESGQARYTLQKMELFEASVNTDDTGAIVYKYNVELQRPAEITGVDGKSKTDGYIGVNYEAWLSVRPPTPGSNDNFEITGWYGNSFGKAYDAAGNNLPLFSNQ